MDTACLPRDRNRLSYSLAFLWRDQFVGLTVAVMACRIVTTSKDRLAAVFLLSIVVGVIELLLALFTLDVRKGETGLR